MTSFSLQHMHVHWLALWNLVQGMRCPQGVEEVITENIVVSAKAVLKGAMGQPHAVASRKLFRSLQVPECKQPPQVASTLLPPLLGTEQL